MFLPGWIMKYYLVALFLGMISAGEIVLVPGVYLGWISNVPLWAILLVTLAGSFTSDTFWFLMGKYFPKKKVMKYNIIQRETERAKVLRPLYEKHKLRVIFYSKFMYGTTLLFQVLSGANHVPYRSYIAMSTLATLVWFLVSTAIGLIITVSIGMVENIIIGIQASLSVMLLIGVGSYVAVRWLAKKRSTEEV